MWRELRVPVLRVLATATLLAVLAFASRDAGELAAGPSVPPNVVVILTDDQRWDTLPTMPQVQSLLVNQGRLFSNAFATTPLCCPSRASLLTGQYAHNTGVRDNDFPGGGFAAFDPSSTLATWLNDAGYATALVGKYLNEYHDVLEAGDASIPPGWDHWFGYQAGYDEFLLNDNGVIRQFQDVYSTDLLRDEALSFINDSLPGDPFFLLFTPFAPHNPSSLPDRHQGSCSTSVPRPPSFNEPDVSDKPRWVRNTPLRKAKEIRNSDAKHRNATCSLKAVDEAVGAIVDALGPELDNTLVFYMSDNGHLSLEHRLSGKNCVYEECIRVPLVVRGPGFATGTDSRLALNIDLAPTILDAAGLAVPPSVDGESLFTSAREDFLIEIEGEERTSNAVRTTRYLYNELATGEKELYDLRNDPFQLTNIANKPRKQSLVTELSGRLDELLLE